TRPALSSDGFNGAALYWRGRLRLISEKASLSWLQWGRALLARKASRQHGGLLRSRASMGPRFIGAEGSSRNSAISRCRQLYNGAALYWRGRHTIPPLASSSCRRLQWGRALLARKAGPSQ